MELDDLKKDWESATGRANNQNMLSAEMIGLVIQKRYTSTIKKIKYPEIAGGIVCFAGICFIIYNFNNLDSFFLKLTGALTIVLLLILPALSLMSLAQLNLKRDLDKSYRDIIKAFAFQKLRFQKYQQVNAFLNYLLLVTTIILLSKICYENDITTNKCFWTLSFSSGYVFLLFCSRRVKKFYGSSLKQAEDLLKEIGTTPK